MSAMVILLIVWGVVFAILLVLLGYRATLGRYEEDQLFLSSANALEAQEQSVVLGKLEKIRPFVQTMIWVTCVLSACIIGLFIWHAIQLL
jgi:hypothetical protein